VLKQPLSVVLAVSVLVLASCSDESDSSDAAQDTSALAAAASTPPSTTATASTLPPTTTTTMLRRYSGQMPQFAAAPPAEKLAPAAGAAPMLSRIETTQPVAFLTIDDGFVQHPEALQLLKEANIPVSLFLVSGAVDDSPQFFGDLQAAGATIQAHTIDHEILKGRSYDFQRGEICGSADQLGQLFGRRPTLFRAPGGAYDETTLQAAADCGMRGVFFWREAVNNGELQFQRPDHVVHPGDIILMHFRDTYVEDFLAAVNGIAASGLTPARLEDYVG
jgi:peptidoglycan/xylan/chitin deacetylase (PgdA/CDA1 family)